MDLNARTKLDDLIRTYPFLTDFLIRLSPKFGKLKNPLMRKTVGKIATIGQAAALGDMPVEKLLSSVAEEIRRVSGAEVRVSAGAGRPSAAIGDRAARHEILKDIIRDLHRGEDMEKLKARFSQLIRDIGPAEIAEMEQKLIEEGMPEAEIKRLCDVHVQVFKESLEGQSSSELVPGHPVETLKAENRALETVLASLEKRLEDWAGNRPEGASAGSLSLLKGDLDRVSEVEKHYLKKENQLFPLLEARGVSGPSKVMWSIHDDIRVHLKGVKRFVGAGNKDEALSLGRQMIGEMRDMIYKEEKILFPMSLETLDENDWARVKHGEDVIGYAWVTPGTKWVSSRPPVEDELRTLSYGQPSRSLELDTGTLTPDLVNLILKHLPLDMSFVDEDDTVRYYSDTAERIFSRSPAVIGRKVQNCHPPASVHIVTRILEAFKSGQKSVAEFWIQKSGRFLHIRYFAVRDKEGAYKGCLEVTQDVTGIRGLEGEKRLLEWK
jgi:DUF438 domain-containing protein